LESDTLATTDAPEQRERVDALADEGVISTDEVCELYPGEWVLMELCPQRPGEFPSHGRLIAHDASRERVGEVLRRMPKLPKESGRSYYLFEAVRHLRTGAEVREALKRLSEMDVDIDEIGMRRW
jgi:hypothetical protein